MVFLLNKKWFAIPVVTFMMIGLVGCADKNNKFGLDNNRNNRNNTQNVRYNPNVRTNDRMNDQNHLNDTPYTIDGKNENYGRRNINNPKSPSYPYKTNPNATNDYWRDAKRMSTKSESLAHKVAKIAANQKDVNSAQSYVAGNTIFVTLDVKDGANNGKVIDKVRSALKRQVKGKNFNIVSDIGSFDQMKNSNRGVSENAPANKLF